MYNEKTIDHFENPRNMGEIKEASTVAQGGNPTCGDVVKLFLNIDNNKIKDIKFQAFGCGACIASTSALTEMVKGKDIKYAKKITNAMIVDYLGGLPEPKLKCSNFSADVLHDALKKF